MDERQAYIELYQGFTLEQLRNRLSLIEEKIVQSQSVLKTDLLRKEIVKQLIQKELDRHTEYYELTAQQDYEDGGA